MRSDGARAVVAAAGSGERASLKALLERAGFSEIREAGDGAGALRLVCEWLPSVLVTDAVLPVLVGFSLAERILNTPLTVYPAVLIAAVPGLPARSCLRSRS